MTDKTLQATIKSYLKSLATREILDLDYSVAPGPYWSYQGRVLTEIYDETYEII